MQQLTEQKEIRSYFLVLTPLLKKKRLIKHYDITNNIFKYVTGLEYEMK